MTVTVQFFLGGILQLSFIHECRGISERLKPTENTSAAAKGITVLNILSCLSNIHIKKGVKGRNFNNTVRL